MKRPLSPHLSIYKLGISALMSVTHRATGIILFTGNLALLLFLTLLAFFKETYPFLAWFLGNIVVQTGLFFYAVSLFYHSFNGLRHMLWDLNIGFERKAIKVTNWLIFGLTIIGVILLWRTIYV
jgi:succinate dehydrogenase / fumarate reductase cytochrome b subunit